MAKTGDTTYGPTSPRLQSDMSPVGKCVRSLIWNTRSEPGKSHSEISVWDLLMESVTIPILVA